MNFFPFLKNKQYQKMNKLKLEVDWLMDARWDI